MFLWSGFERLTAMALHMALSVLVFASVRTSRRWLYPAAILIHYAAVSDAVGKRCDPVLSAAQRKPECQKAACLLKQARRQTAVEAIEPDVQEDYIMPIGTIAAIVAVIILVIAVPLGTMPFLHKRGGAWTTFLIGAGTFIGRFRH